MALEIMKMVVPFGPIGLDPKLPKTLMIFLENEAFTFTTNFYH